MSEAQYNSVLVFICCSSSENCERSRLYSDPFSLSDLFNRDLPHKGTGNARLDSMVSINPVDVVLPRPP